MPNRNFEPRDQRIDDALDTSGVRHRATFKQEWPLLLLLLFVWGALWQDFSLGNMIFGAVIALVIVNLFPLPPVVLSGRINLWYCLKLFIWFMGQVVVASFHVAKLAIANGKKTHSAIIAVPLRTGSDLIVMTVGHVLTLIPGSFVIDVDRSSSTLYLHYIDIESPADVEKARAAIRDIERRLIMAIGSPDEYEAIKNECGPDFAARKE
ncbi:MAG TPA: Na+/H+ antiporter subunit E [Glutamicibacter sp.]|uniref:Na+/H+ antiporter subunit E n=2 Tax=Glutamicibacter arilaitensis TaxID=256701 RepID=A0A2N7S726_9MICC|nr:Na+/H+ antiporter subunit E [Glutamicibacter sp.]PMQ21945.1 Na+/H+ antiporter subunit E [Glutamicibacter arilaitensis]HCH46375.1 Na+/H+ antiporter subunit E [Glutamicibacter sp.]HCJ55347.1 Na+/H+ antiporter subunit E [Glutamicibacter sp.]HCM95203.1 Na+/H+ antiporter subunit E [Glutamicibacter sp.]